MKHNLMPLQTATIAGLLLFSGIAFAQGAGTGTVAPSPATAAPIQAHGTTDKKAETQNLREKAQALKTEVTEKKAELKDQRAELKEKVSAIRAGKMSAEKKARLVGVVRKLSKQVNNVEALLTRTESRIAKIAAQGGDTSSSATFAGVVKTKIAEAKAAIEDLKAKAQSAASSETKEKVAEITDGARAVEAKIKEARGALADTINSLKPGLNTPKTATTTPRK